MINKKEICAIIITYLPNSSLTNICTSLSFANIDTIIIDNSPEEFVNDIFENLPKSILIVRNKENFGIAKALNIGSKIAFENQYKYIITLDQDSILLKEFFESILDSDYIKSNADIGFLGSNYYLKNGQKRKENFNYNEKWIKRDYLISSGCIINLKKLFEIGGFDENLFIDYVDIDLSLRFRKKGYKLFMSKNPLMIHQPGNIISKKILGISISSSNHPAIRRYYMTRNLILISKKHFFRFPLFILKTTFFYFFDFVKMILVENELRLKLQFIVLGLKYGLLNK